MPHVLRQSRVVLQHPAHDGLGLRVVTSQHLHTRQLAAPILQQRLLRGFVVPPLVHSLAGQLLRRFQLRAGPLAALQGHGLLERRQVLHHLQGLRMLRAGGPRQQLQDLRVLILGLVQLAQGGQHRGQHVSAGDGLLVVQAQQLLLRRLGLLQQRMGLDQLHGAPLRLQIRGQDPCALQGLVVVSPQLLDSQLQRPALHLLRLLQGAGGQQQGGQGVQAAQRIPVVGPQHALARLQHFAAGLQGLVHLALRLQGAS
mmetsp:Transcript_84210/g.201869  ORF Transcript_84210/g.201869 Transcript_84210/m.201869 type:complete len:256 (+) Transcript_84210:618-1385(+)